MSCGNFIDQLLHPIGSGECVPISMYTAWVCIVIYIIWRAYALLR